MVIVVDMETLDTIITAVLVMETMVMVMVDMVMVPLLY